MLWVTRDDIEKLISYTAFGELRLQEFLPPGAKVVRDQSGYECCVGEAGIDAYRGVTFSRPVARPNEVYQIELFFRKNVEGGCSREIAERIMAATGLPVRPNMTGEQITDSLGGPQTTHREPTELMAYEFVCHGQQNSTYEICLWVDDVEGLCALQMVRSDTTTGGYIFSATARPASLQRSGLLSKSSIAFTLFIASASSFV